MNRENAKKSFNILHDIGVFSGKSSLPSSSFCLKGVTIMQISIRGIKGPRWSGLIPLSLDLLSNLDLGFFINLVLFEHINKNQEISLAYLDSTLETELSDVLNWCFEVSPPPERASDMTKGKLETKLRERTRSLVALSFH